MGDDMNIIDEATSNALKRTFENELKDAVNLVIITDKNETRGVNKKYADVAKQIGEELREINNKILVQNFEISDNPYGVKNNPTVLIEPEKYKIKYTGAPIGHEFQGFVDTILMVSKGESGLSSDSKEALKKVDKPILLQVFITPSCPYCPLAVTLANRLAIENSNITAECVEAYENIELSQKFSVSSVPHQVINGEPSTSFIGAFPEDRVIRNILNYLGKSV